MKRIAALFVEKGGPYSALESVDVWDEEADARIYPGPYPVVAHPPCARWCRLAGVNAARWGVPKGEDDGCFGSALAAVREWGGVLEHPAYTDAWPAFGLHRPSRGAWGQGLWDPGWVCEVSQAAYGHRARKLTWLYYVGKRPPPEMRWEYPDGEAQVSFGKNPDGEYWRPPLSSNDASRTPDEFRDVLLDLARRAT